MKTVFGLWLPWALVALLALLLVATLAVLAYLFSFLMSGAWYRWKYKGALKERELLAEIRKIVLDRKWTESGELSAVDCEEIVALVDEERLP